MKSRAPFAKKSLGQNFLVDPSVIDQIVSALDPHSEDVLVEIGPGHGALTERLAERVGHLYAFELDTELARGLAEKFRDNDSIQVFEADALSVEFEKLAAGRKLRLVANLPYNVSTAILRHLFASADVFQDCVLMFQREVVERIAAVPGSKERGFLSVLTQAHFDVEKLFDVPPAAFRPVPKVWSSVARLVPRTERPFDPPVFEEVVSVSFRQKRKSILNNLRDSWPDAGSVLPEIGIDPRRRAETLTLDEWTRLASAAKL